jgi:hypothetical protein
MEILKQLKFVILLVFVLIILVLFRLGGKDNFKPGADKFARPSVTRTNIIAADRIETLKGEKILINLISGEKKPVDIAIKTIEIPANEVLNKEYISVLRNHKGPILLYSPDNGLSARIWMLLSQMGFSNLYIVSDSDRETFKNEFRPDTLFRPEL